MHVRKMEEFRNHTSMRVGSSLSRPQTYICSEIEEFPIPKPAGLAKVFLGLYRSPFHVLVWDLMGMSQTQARGHPPQNCLNYCSTFV